MAKGQIHMGKNGPEKCSVDSSKARSRGCPYEATGHYSTVDEAMESYATLNRVDPGELKTLVADGATPKDAVGLIRSGYGIGYLEAAKRDSGRIPETTLADVTASYLEAKTQLSLAFDGLSSGLAIEGTESTQGTPGLILRKSANQGVEGFSYVVVNEGGTLSFEQLSVGSSTQEAEAIGAQLKAAIYGDDSTIRDELARMLDSYRKMRAEESQIA